MSERVSISGWTDYRRIRGLLERVGVDHRVAEDKARLLQRCAESLLHAGLPSGGSATGFFVPGRIEVLGKHTDYAGGRSLVAAAERGFCLLACPRDDRGVGITDSVSGQCCRFELDPELSVPAGTWFNYPMTVGRRLARNFGDPPLRGTEIAFASDLPAASGMSSSSALVVATYLALEAVNDLPARSAWRANIHDRLELAEYLGCVENGQSYRCLAGDRGVGTFGGSEDHTAMLRALKGHLVEHSYCPIRYEGAVAMPDGCELAVGCSGVVAEKTGSAMEKYNRASRLAAAVAAEWRRATGRGDPHIAAALHSAPDAADAMRRALSRPAAGPWTARELLNRMEHFLAESEQIVPASVGALRRGDLPEFARQVDRSQELAERLLGNQVEQTVFLARSARELGALAASAFGAGFGGSVWAMVRADEAAGFLRRWQGAYHGRFPDRQGRSAFFLSGASGPAVRIPE